MKSMNALTQNQMKPLIHRAVRMSRIRNRPRTILVKMKILLEMMTLVILIVTIMNMKIMFLWLPWKQILSRKYF